jgi:hypothetical protein
MGLGAAGGPIGPERPGAVVGPARGPALAGSVDVEAEAEAPQGPDLAEGCADDGPAGAGSNLIVQCEECGTGAAVLFCLECEVLYCVSCSSDVHGVEDLAGHVTQPLAAGSAASAVPDAAAGATIGPQLPPAAEPAGGAAEAGAAIGPQLPPAAAQTGGAVGPELPPAAEAAVVAAAVTYAEGAGATVPTARTLTPVAKDEAVGQRKRPPSSGDLHSGPDSGDGSGKRARAAAVC